MDRQLTPAQQVVEALRPTHDEVLVLSWPHCMRPEAVLAARLQAAVKRAESWSAHLSAHGGRDALGNWSDAYIEARRLLHDVELAYNQARHHVVTAMQGYDAGAIPRAAAADARRHPHLYR